MTSKTTLSKEQVGSLGLTVMLSVIYNVAVLIVIIVISFVGTLVIELHFFF